MIPLGSKVKDVITGYAGIAVARSEWITGCVRYGVDREGLTKEGNFPDTIWIDESRLKIVKAAKKDLLTTPTPTEGGASNPRMPSGG